MTARLPARRCALGLAVLVCIATATYGQSAPADCDGDGAVTIDEITRAVNIALGLQPLGVCLAADVDGDGSVDIAELIAAVRAALGEPGATPTPTSGSSGGATPTATAAATDTASPTGATPTSSATATATLEAPTPTSTRTPTIGLQIIDIGDAFNQVGGVVPFCVELFGPEDVASLTVDLCLSSDVFVVDGVECSADLFQCPISIDPDSVAVAPTEHFPTCELDDGQEPHGQVRTSVQSATAGAALPLGTLLGCTVQVRSDALPGVYPVDIRAAAVRLGGETLVGIDTANANVSALGPGGECLSDAQCNPQICRGGHCCGCACEGSCDDFGECSTAPCFGTLAAGDRATPWGESDLAR